MWNVIICDGDEPEREQLMGFVRQYFEEKKKDAQIAGCMDWPELEGMVKQSLPDVVIVAPEQRGWTEYYYQRQTPVPENHMVFRFGFRCSGISAVRSLFFHKAGYLSEDGTGSDPFL